MDEPWPLVCASATFIGAILLSIEDIAVQIEEPFAILPLQYQHMWLLRDVEKTRSLMEWSLQQQQRRDPERAPAEPASLRGAGRPSARAAWSRVSAVEPGGGGAVEGGGGAVEDAASRPAEPTGAAERLAQLRELVDAGLLTDAEYEEKRQRIVSAL